MTRRSWSLMFAAVLAFSAPARAEVETSVALDLAAGYDSNPLQQSGQGEGSGFLELGLDASLDHRVGKRVGWFFDADGSARAHPEDFSSGDVHHLASRLGARVQPIPKLRFELGGLYELRRMTFVDRLTGDVYTIERGGELFPIPARFDADSWGGFANVSWLPFRHARVFLETSLEEIDYVEDYETIPELEALDFRALTVVPGFQYRFGDTVTMVVSYEYVAIDYHEQLSRDLDGDLVPGSLRSYREGELRLTLTMRPAERWRIQLGVRGGDRQDLYAGYYDYAAQTAYGSVNYRPTDRWNVRLYAYTRTRDYDNQTVPEASSELEYLHTDVRRVLAQAQRQITEHFSVFGEAGLSRTDSVDVEYTHDREWMLSGIRLSF